MSDASAVVAGRNFLVYSVPFDATNKLPADTVLWGTTWGTPALPAPAQTSPWVARGYTSGGLNFAMAVTRGEIRVDQEFDPVLRPITARTVTLQTQFAEMSVANIQLASGMGDLDVSVSTHIDLNIGSTITDQFNSWGFDIRQQDGTAFRVFVPKGISTGTVTPRFIDTAAALIDLQVNALVDTSSSPSRVATIRDVLP